MTDVTAVYPGRPAFYLLLRVTGVAPVGSAELWAINPNGSSSTFALDCLSLSVGVSGNVWGGCHNLDFRGGQSQILLWSGSVPLAIGANPISASHGGSVFGVANVAGSHFSPNPATRPPAPLAYPVGTSGLDQITTTSMRYRMQDQGDGGSAITSRAAQYSTTPDFSSGNSGLIGLDSSGTYVATGLTPGTTYYWRSRNQNAVGVSDWSPTTNASTLPMVPPGLSVVPSLDGTEATATLIPPGGIGSVTKYQLERRLVGGAAVSVDVFSSPYVQAGLTPGATYEWRARAVIGTYESPWSDWLLVAQPNPNTNPGDYFDGSSADTADVDFVWTGTVNNSTSKAQGKRATGWRTFAQGLGASGATSGSQVRVTGGRSGVFASRVTFWADAAAAGYRGGTSVDQPGLVDVAEGGVYWGSVYVQPSRAQRMAAEVQFYDAALAPLGAAVVGAAQVVPSTVPMTRLVVQATAPNGAEWASVGWRDIAGAGHSPWRGGESVLQDDAMVSIGELLDWFSGDTSNTAQFAYSWLGAANASESQREALDPDDFDPLADPDCPPLPLPPTAPVISDDCLDEVGTWRRYWAIIPANQVSEWLALVPTIYVTTGPLAARQVRIRVYRNPDGLDPSAFPATEWDAEQIISYIPPLTVLTLDGVAQRVWAEVNGGDSLSADRLLYGTGGGPATWPVLSCGTGYLISFDVPLDAPEGNLSVDVALTTRML